MTEPDALFDRILVAQQDRRADRLFLKYTAMRESSFRFFRATPYLFYQDWSANWSTIQTPVSWVCADLHLENAGSFRAANKLIYFDINDFDEALLGPCTVDIARLAVSLFLAAPLLRYSPATGRLLAQRLVEAYSQALLLGKPRSIERETAGSLLKQLIQGVADRAGGELVAHYTSGKGTKRRLATDGVKLLALAGPESDAVRHWLEVALAEQTRYRLHDVATRIAGTSSLALNRYVVLVTNPAGKYRLLDLKAARPSAAAPYLAVIQPTWPDPATRVVTLQNRLQDVCPALLKPIAGPDGEHFVLRMLQPQADRVDLTRKHNRLLAPMTSLITTMAQLTASAHLRSGGHQGSAIADELVAFGANPSWIPALLSRAESYAGQVQQDYRYYKAAFDAGRFGRGGQLT